MNIDAAIVGIGTSAFGRGLAESQLALAAQAFKSALEIPLGSVKVRVLPIERIIASKKAANREKDRLTLKRLEAAAITIREAQAGPVRKRPRTKK